MSPGGSRSLRSQLVATFLAIAILPSALLGLLAGRYLLAKLREDVAARNLQVALAVSGEVGRFLEAQLVYLHNVVLLVSARAETTSSIETHLALHLSANPALKSILLLDDRGVVGHVVPFDADVRGIDLSRQPFVREARARGEPTWSSATIAMQTGQPMVTLVVPGNPWTAVGYLDLEALRTIVERPRIGPSGDAAVIDSDGTVIAHWDRRLVREQVNVKEPGLVAEALAGRDGTAEISFLGRPHLGSAVRVPLTHWAVLVAEPVEKAYAQVYRIRDLLFAVVGAALVAAVAAGVLSARRILRPLQALSGHTRRIAAGDLGTPAASAPGPGFHELDALSRDFDAMVSAVRMREEALERSEASYRRLVSAPQVGVLRSTMAGEILFANEAMARLLGLDSPRDARGRSIIPFYKDPAERERLLREVTEQGRAANRELHFVTAAGEERVVLINVARDDETLTSVLVDITDLTRAAADRARLEQQLFHAQKVEAVGRLAGGVAHDFNNLLTAIIAEASHIRDSRPDAASTRESAEGILDAAGRAANLTRSLLAFGRKQVLQRKPVDLREVVDGVAKMLRRLIGEDMEFEVSLPEESLVAVADRGQIEQVLVNLCTNARDAMPGGGRLEVSADRVDLSAQAARSLDLARGGAYVRIRVRDTGVGMSREVQERAFEPFFTTKEAGKGTGLGLAIVYGIVRQHEGAISVSSSPRSSSAGAGSPSATSPTSISSISSGTVSSSVSSGTDSSKSPAGTGLPSTTSPTSSGTGTAGGTGTTFTVLLPAASEPVERPFDAPANRPVPGGRETILLAEDEPTVRSVLRRTLEEAGYRVVESSDGEEAVRRFEESPENVELCLLDVVMPRMNGREAFEAISALRPDVPVVLLSGYAADVLEDRSAGLRGPELLSKPITPAELLDKVRGALDRARTRRSVP